MTKPNIHNDHIKLTIAEKAALKRKASYSTGSTRQSKRWIETQKIKTTGLARIAEIFFEDDRLYDSEFGLTDGDENSSSSDEEINYGKRMRLRKIHDSPHIYVVEDFLTEKELIYFERKIQSANANGRFEKSFLDGDVSDESSQEEEDTAHEQESDTGPEIEVETSDENRSSDVTHKGLCQDPLMGPKLQDQSQIETMNHCDPCNSNNTTKSSVIIPDPHEPMISSNTSMTASAQNQVDTSNPFAIQTNPSPYSMNIPPSNLWSPPSNEHIHKDDEESKAVEMDPKPSEVSIEENDVLRSDPDTVLERKPESRKVVSFGKLNCVVNSKAKNGIFVVSVEGCRNRIGVLYAGDIITHLNGIPLSEMSLEHFVNLLQQVGERRELTVITPHPCENNILTSSNTILSKQPSASIPQRTSTFIHFPKLADANIARIENRVAELFSLPNHCIEPLQLVKYETGQYFAEHHDTGILFDDYSIELPHKSLTSAPRRIVTVLVYLSDVPEEAGGKTVFPLLDDPKTGKKGMSVIPKRGTALMWCNINKYGLPDSRLVHAGEPLHSGAIKYAMNIWVCEE